MDAAEKALEKAEKEAAKAAPIDKEEKFDAFGNKIEEKKTAQKIPSRSSRRSRRRSPRAASAARCFTDDEIEKAGYDPMM